MAKNENVNYIKHLLAISEKFIDDDRLGPLHVSLYYALFQSWNLSRFRNPISINREEMMRTSKVGSANTYTKCLKELDSWNYIQYLPSHNPHKGSQIYLYNFNKTTNNGNNISSNKSINKTNTQGSVKALRPSINSSNNINKTNKINHEPTRRKINKKSSLINRKTTGSKNKKVPRPGRRQIETYFAKKQWPSIEAEKFFNYYSSNGWLVGGKTPMNSWKASAKNWILNSKTFTNGKVGSGKLNVTTDKNYNEPL